MSNCILWAFALWFRRRGHVRRCYVSWRKSDWGWFPHVLYTELRPYGKWRVVSYKPVNPKRRAFPPPLFRGRPRWGD